MLDFKNGKINVLLVTDVLSRGIHMEGIDLMDNYDVPPDSEDYVHRIGRTARAASKGTANYIYQSERLAPLCRY